MPLAKYDATDKLASVLNTRGYAQGDAKLIADTIAEIAEEAIDGYDLDDTVEEALARIERNREYSERDDDPITERELDDKFEEFEEDLDEKLDKLRDDLESDRDDTRDEFTKLDDAYRCFTRMTLWQRLRWLATGALPEGGAL